MNKKLYDLMDWPTIEAVVYSEEDKPRSILGAHVTESGVLIQTFQPYAKAVTIKLLNTETVYPMELADEDGFFSFLMEGIKQIPRYKLLILNQEGEKEERWDPYFFSSPLTREETQRINDGTSDKIFDQLGAHPRKIDGVEGVHFAVWAPSAIRVSVVGGFNAWDGRVCPMNRVGDSGIFALFIPEISVGDSYQFEIKYKGERIMLKLDPYANQIKDSASIVSDLTKYRWNDKEWILARKKINAKTTPLSICEVDLEWLSKEKNKNEIEDLNYRELATMIGEYMVRCGHTHVALNKVMEQEQNDNLDKIILGFYAPMSRFGSPEDFMYLIDYLHQKNLGVIVNWQTSCFSKHLPGLLGFDGTCLYEHQDLRQRMHGKMDALLFNYGRPEVKNFLMGNAFYWLEKYHIDGLHLSDVRSMIYLDYGKQKEQWIPNYLGGNENLEAISFLRELNLKNRAKKQGNLLFASETELWPSCTDLAGDMGLGFDFVFDLEWNNHLIEYIKLEPQNRNYQMEEIMHSFAYAQAESFVLPLRYNKEQPKLATVLQELPGDDQQKVGNLKLIYGYQYMHPGKKLDFMDCTFGEELTKYLYDLNKLYFTEPALSKWDHKASGCSIIKSNTDSDGVFIFTRNTNRKEEMLLIAMNFSELNLNTYKIGVPYEGSYKEIFNSDSINYGGSGLQNKRKKDSKKDVTDGKANFIKIAIPAYSFVVFRYQKINKIEQIA